jgi:hypothetical protein
MSLPLVPPPTLSKKRTSTNRRKELVLDIEQNGIEMAPCTACRTAKVAEGGVRPKCIMGPRSSKCSECLKHNRKSCDASLSYSQWQKLRDAREKLRRDIESLEEEEVVILQRLSQDQQRLAEKRMKKIRLRKQLRQAERRTDSAAVSALDELEMEEPPSVVPDLFDVSPGVELADNSFLQDILEMPVQDWGTLTGVALDDPFEGLFPFESLGQEAAVQ